MKDAFSMFENYPDVVTVKDLCRMLNIGRNTAYELIRSEQIASLKIGRQVRIGKNAVIRYIEIGNKLP